MPMHPLWTQCLQDQYQWIASVAEDEDADLVQLARDVLATVDPDDSIQDVYESSVWAVCMAYLDYAEGTHALSDEDLDYTRSRGGLIGMRCIQGETVWVTIREILEHRDPGFFHHMNPNLQPTGPPGA